MVSLQSARDVRRFVGAAIVACITLVLVLAWASNAHAADQVFFEGLLNNQSATAGFSEPVSQTSARSLDGNSVCVAAVYYSGGPLAGNVVCDTDLAVHAYCHCDYKLGYVRSLIGGNVNARARMTWPS